MRFTLKQHPALLIPMLLLPLSVFSQDSKDEKTQTVLFVCEHGAAKSVIAASYFDKLAKEKGLNYKAVFRGTHPDPVLNPVAENGLNEDGISTRGLKPQLVTSSDIETASRVVTLGCTLPDKESIAGKVQEWNDVPSPSQDYKTARDDILNKVSRLVDELSKRDQGARPRKP